MTKMQTLTETFDKEDKVNSKIKELSEREKELYRLTMHRIISTISPKSYTEEEKIETEREFNRLYEMTDEEYLIEKGEENGD